MSRKPSKNRSRLDVLVVERGLADSRTRAQAMVLAGVVVVEDHTVDKPGTMVRTDAQVRLKRGHEGVLPYASRGGLKLRGALDSFSGLEVAGRVAMDVGASTGGFTDCLLQAGAAQVFAVDVGYGQLVWKLSQDPRVVVLDRENIRSLSPDKVTAPVSLAVMDCSFISLRKVLAPLPKFLAPEADVVALVKPQFEVGREGVGKGGIVRDPALRQRAQEDVVEAAQALGFALEDRCISPILGREGNEESFVWLRWGSAPMLGDS